MHYKAFASQRRRSGALARLILRRSRTMRGRFARTALGRALLEAARAKAGLVAA